MIRRFIRRIVREEIAAIEREAGERLALRLKRTASDAALCARVDQISAAYTSSDMALAAEVQALRAEVESLRERVEAGR